MNEALEYFPMLIDPGPQPCKLEEDELIDIMDALRNLSGILLCLLKAIVWSYLPQ